MNILNRILVVIGLIVSIVLALSLILFPVSVIDGVRANLDALEQLLYSDRPFFIFIGVMALCAVVALVLLVLELRRPRKKTVLIHSEGDGQAELGVESIEQSLEYRIDELAGVREVNCKIRSRGRDAQVFVNLNTSPSVNIPVLTGQIMDLARDIVEGQLGVRIRGKVRVNVKHEPYPRGTMPPAEPLPERGEAIATPSAMSSDERRAEKPKPKPEPSKESAKPVKPYEGAEAEDAIEAESEEHDEVSGDVDDSDEDKDLDESDRDSEKSS